jgi:hypothetical protein
MINEIFDIGIRVMQLGMLYIKIVLALVILIIIGTVYAVFSYLL